MLLAMAFILILAIWAVSYSRSALHSSWVSYRIEQEMAARNILESAIDEAFLFWDHETTDPEKPFSRWLISQTDRSAQTLEKSELPLTAQAITDLLEAGGITVESLTVVAKKRGDDFRNSRNASGNPPYYGNEGHGTLALTGSIRLARGKKAFLEFQIERHHDYKVTGIVSRRNAGSSRENALNRCLDYVLYVRNGLNEFRQTRGRMLNRKGLNLDIVPNNTGHIYFGGTGSNKDYVFINIYPEQADQIPDNLISDRPLSQTELEQIADRMLKREPELDDVLAEAIADSDSYTSGDTKLFLVDLMASLDSRLRSKYIPIDPESGEESVKYVHEALFDKFEVSNRLADNNEPGIKLLQAGDNAGQIIEGAVRKRFIDLITSSELDKFIIDISSNLVSTRFLAALKPEHMVRRSKNLSQTPEPLALAIDEILSELSPSPLKTPVTRIDEEFPYGSNREADRGTILQSCRLPESDIPFQYGNLRSYSLQDIADLKAEGFLKNNRLFLQGALYVRSGINLGEEGATTCIGRGVMTINGDLTISSGLKTEPGSTAVFSCNGNLIIDTSEQVEAAIMARSIVVKPGKKLNLKGSVWVDNLGSAFWPEGDHRIEYDNSRFDADHDLYAVNISPRSTYLRFSRGDL